MKYQVIVSLNELNGKRYYHSYVESGGNIVCDDLPPFQDINKARSCYWDDEKWIFDEIRYTEILAEIAQAKADAEAETDRIARIPSNEELNEMILSAYEAINELAMFDDAVVTPLSDMAKLLVKDGD